MHQLPMCQQALTHNENPSKQAKPTSTHATASPNVTAVTHT